MTTEALPLTMPQLDPASPAVSPTEAARLANDSALKQTPAGRKLIQAAAEFEAMLICSWWEEAEKDIKDPFQGDMSGGSDGLKSLAMKTLATKMAAGGGIGISRMIFRSLEPALQRKLQHENGSANPAAVSEQEQGVTANPTQTGGYRH